MNMAKRYHERRNMFFNQNLTKEAWFAKLTE